MVKREITELRNLMTQNGIDAYWVPGTDPHQSEYLPEAWNRRSWLSGFNGSAGDCVVMQDTAWLWTDSRYFLQAGSQLKDSGIQLMKMGEPGVPEIPDFLKKNLKGKLGLDPQLFLSTDASDLQNKLGEENVVFIEENLVDSLWKDRPSLPLAPVQPLSETFTGQSVSEKLARVRSEMEKSDADFHVISQLDAICWLFNIRGEDVMYNPVVVSYAAIGKENAWLFIDERKHSQALVDALPDDVNILKYNEFGVFLEARTRGLNVLIDKGTASQWMVGKLEQARVIRGTSPVTLLKARKNAVELEGIRKAHERDGASMVRFFMWLEKEVPGGKVTEISASEKLTGFRSTNRHYQGQSFGSISGYASNGAIVHYSATGESDRVLKPEGIYLIDSGGQYLDGTTDITRTLALGQPTAEQKDRFTRVLKGHLTLKNARFPRGTTGPQLDTLARKALWDVSLNYGHGTGHGVGHYLCVHEGPQAISYYRGAGVAMEPGMVVSNEPGYYKAGEYGIRIENLVYVVEAPSNPSDPSVFYTFENLTMCPIDKKLVDVDLLSEQERIAFNAYHEEVYRRLVPYLDQDEQAWLKEATTAL